MSLNILYNILHDIKKDTKKVVYIILITTCVVIEQFFAYKNTTFINKTKLHIKFLPGK